MAFPTLSSAQQAKVEALLAGMSLDQKIGQMTMVERMTCTPEQARIYHIGAILGGAGSVPGDNEIWDWVAMNDAYWEASTRIDEQHCGIPLLYGTDAIHGHNNAKGATVFPHNIGIGASRDPALARRIAAVTAREILSTGVEWAFSPTLAVAQDGRWGRNYESYSEDPDLVASYAGEIVSALQQDLGDDSVISCVKHWVGDGGTEHGIDQGNVTGSFETLQNLHIKPYLPALKAGALTVMVSYNSWNGTKCHGNRYLVEDILKGKLGFRGFVVSDWEGIELLSEDYYLAVAEGVNAGIDMFMVPESWQTFIDHVRDHVLLGTIKVERINDAVRRILQVKMAYGLFDKPRPSERKWSLHRSFGSASHRQLAREAVRKSLVLLKNENLLPLDADTPLLVAGKNAHNIGHQCGGFTVSWQGDSGNDTSVGGTSIWEGIQALCPAAELCANGNGSSADASRHRVAIVVVGEKPYAEGLGDIRDGDELIIQTGSQIKGQMKLMEPYGKSLHLDQLHPEDIATIKTIRSKGIPVVTVLISGRPLICDSEIDLSEAFVAAWLPGSEGKGLAEVLFGECDFSGKLGFRWPAANNGERYPLGYGLDYANAKTGSAKQRGSTVRRISRSLFKRA